MLAIQGLLYSLSLGFLSSPQIRCSGSKLLVYHPYRQEYCWTSSWGCFPTRVWWREGQSLVPSCCGTWLAAGRNSRGWSLYFSIDLAGEVPASPFIWVRPHFFQQVTPSGYQGAKGIPGLCSLQGPAFCAHCHWPPGPRSIPVVFLKRSN